MIFSCSRSDNVVIHINTYGNARDYTFGLTSSEYINTIIKIIVIIIISDGCSFYKITHVASEEIRPKKIIQSNFFYLGHLTRSLSKTCSNPFQTFYRFLQKQLTAENRYKNYFHKKLIRSNI